MVIFSRVDSKSEEICNLVNKDISRAKAEIKAVVNKNKKEKMKARIKSGEFSEFTAEEF